MGYFGNPIQLLLVVAVALVVYAFSENHSALAQTLLVVGAIVLVVVALKFFWPRNSEDDW